MFAALARWLTRRRDRVDDPLGRRGEALAARCLRRQGMRILERNWRWAGGEIDLIAREGQWLVIVEVKTREGDRVRPEEQVHPAKQEKLRRGALAYCRRFGQEQPPVRFDVVAIVWPGAGQPQVTHFPHAFEGV